MEVLCAQLTLWVKYWQEQFNHWSYLKNTGWLYFSTIAVKSNPADKWSWDVCTNHVSIIMQICDCQQSSLLISNPKCKWDAIINSTFSLFNRFTSSWIFQMGNLRYLHELWVTGNDECLQFFCLQFIKIYQLALSNIILQCLDACKGTQLGHQLLIFTAFLIILWLIGQFLPLQLVINLFQLFCLGSNLCNAGETFCMLLFSWLIHLDDTQRGYSAFLELLLPPVQHEKNCQLVFPYR